MTNRSSNQQNGAAMKPSEDMSRENTKDRIQFQVIDVNAAEPQFPPPRRSDEQGIRLVANWWDWFPCSRYRTHYFRSCYFDSFRGEDACYGQTILCSPCAAWDCLWCSPPGKTLCYARSRRFTVAMEASPLLSPCMVFIEAPTLVSGLINVWPCLGVKWLMDLIACCANPALHICFGVSQQDPDYVVYQISRHFDQPKPLIALDIGEINLSDQGARAIAKYITTSRDLQTIKVAKNRISNQMHKELVRALMDSLAPLKLVQGVVGFDMEERDRVLEQRRLEVAKQAKEAEEHQFEKQRQQEQKLQQDMERNMRAQEEQNRVTRIAMEQALYKEARVKELRQMLIDMNISEKLAGVYAENLFNQHFETVSKIRLADVNDLMACKFSRGDAKVVVASLSGKLTAVESVEELEALAHEVLTRTSKRYLIFISYHQAGAAAEANAIYRYLISRGFREETIFFDQTTLRDIRSLAANVEKSIVLLQLQSPEVYNRPFTLIEAYTALKSGVSVVPIALGSYDFDQAAAFLKSPDFVEALNQANKGAAAEISNHGIDPRAVGTLLANEFPNLRSFPLRSRETQRVQASMLADIFDIIVEKLKLA